MKTFLSTLACLALGCVAASPAVTAACVGLDGVNLAQCVSGSGPHEPRRISIDDVPGNDQPPGRDEHNHGGDPSLSWNGSGLRLYVDGLGYASLVDGPPPAGLPTFRVAVLAEDGIAVVQVGEARIV